jgi:hypothetical protein
MHQFCTYFIKRYPITVLSSSGVMGKDTVISFLVCSPPHICIVCNTYGGISLGLSFLF